jgi:hypothetical protein
VIYYESATELPSPALAGIKSHRTFRCVKKARCFTTRLTVSKSSMLTVVSTPFEKTIRKHYSLSIAHLYLSEVPSHPPPHHTTVPPYQHCDINMSSQIPKRPHRPSPPTPSKKPRTSTRVPTRLWCCCKCEYYHAPTPQMTCDDCGHKFCVVFCTEEVWRLEKPDNTQRYGGQDG